ncbi:MAG: tail fiber domain-containing protein, partial [Steroidobacteraceae bacterium]
AVGSSALNYNTSGNGNTATGSSTLNYNTTGSYNTANGNGALFNNTTGYSNTATGGSALSANTVGSGNTAVGISALEANTTGSNMVAVGSGALQNVNLVAESPNTTVPGNMTAIGYQALSNDTTGVDNIALGYEAGYNVTIGSNNIHIGNVGAAADNKVIKIGTEGTQKKTFIAGIYSNTTVSGLAVVIGSNGELGVVASSERLKTDIATMGSATEKLQELRPVTFHYKNDQQGELRYGLIAEEVAKAYPELVVRDENGRIDGVRYDELAPMLLNEMQREHSALVAQHEADAARIGALEKKVAEVDDLKQQLAAVIEELKAGNKLVAQR